MTGDSGAASLLVAGLLLVAVLCAGLVADLARLAGARAQLVAAADAAALAAAPVTFATFGSTMSPRQAATWAAGDNGADLVECVCGLDSSWRRRRVVVTVSTRVGLWLFADRELRAVAAAEFSPVQLGLP